MFCSEVMIKIFSPIKSRRPWLPNSISHLFQQGLFSSWPLLFLHLGCVCLDNLFQSFHMRDGGIVNVQYLVIAYNCLYDLYISDCNYVASNEADYLATQKSYSLS